MNIDIRLEGRTANKWLHLRKAADKRGKEFNLSISDVKSLMSRKTCAFTGVVLVDTYVGEIPPNLRTIDRLDNDKGYVRGNVVVCSHSINQAKGSLTLKELGCIYKVLKQRGML